MAPDEEPVSASERALATRLPATHAAGAGREADELLPLVYDNLRSLAAKFLRGERPGSTLSPNLVWFVHFGTGVPDVVLKDYPFYVRAVRGGP